MRIGVRSQPEVVLTLSAIACLLHAAQYQCRDDGLDRAAFDVVQELLEGPGRAVSVLWQLQAEAR